MKTKHTPEPWTAYRHTGPTGPMKVESANRVIAEVLKAETIEEQTANAERIAACVNACAGINPEAVPELLAKLEALANAASVVNVFLDATPAHRTADIYNLRNCIEQARAAITNATNQPTP